MVGMNQHIIFDRTRYTDKLRDNGVDEKTARAHSDALDGALRDAVATKADLQDVRLALEADIAGLKQELKSDISELKSDMVELRQEVQALEGRIDVRFAEQNTKFAEQAVKFETAKLDILRWVVATQVALAGLIIGVFLKFMK
jgi:predicted  nucleic acid-binding Zn-ribbon protein